MHRPRPEYVWSAKQKIIIQRISGGTRPLVAAIDTNQMLSFASTNILLIKEEYLKGVKFHFVKTVMEVLDIALLKTKVEKAMKIG